MFFSQVSWDSVRLADKPLVETSTIGMENKNNLMTQNVATVSPSMHNDENIATMIAGQLIIYDLDEEPPMASQLKREKGKVVV